MKKILSFVMGLSALMAFSPQPASAAPDTGPKAHNDEVFQEFSKAGVSEIDYQIMDNGKMIITRITFTNGRQVVPEQSDHPVAMSNEAVKKYLVNLVIDPAVPVKGNFLSYNVSISALAAVEPDRQRPCNCAIMNGYSTLDLDLSKNSTGLAAMTATASALPRHSVAWVTSYLSGGPSLRL